MIQCFVPLSNGGACKGCLQREKSPKHSITLGDNFPRHIKPLPALGAERGEEYGALRAGLGTAGDEEGEGHGDLLFTMY